ncbi:hypothetical protein K402DRAFT_425119 [Aulographum hederae CBS 113979]|uniref:Uncharacterized protein n=1 Tax=Aulographum hederae CBS 113979 TaxID=1176131 RepID=A0A6G1GM41_9PEZI|nr:hypothetical protein K402DRAFT_425119 [Aulographum hederae CBS 113979]
MPWTSFKLPWGQYWVKVMTEKEIEESFVNYYEVLGVYPADSTNCVIKMACTDILLPRSSAPYNVYKADDFSCKPGDYTKVTLEKVERTELGWIKRLFTSSPQTKKGSMQNSTNVDDDYKASMSTNPPETTSINSETSSEVTAVLLSSAQGPKELSLNRYKPDCLPFYERQVLENDKAAACEFLMSPVQRMEYNIEYGEKLKAWQPLFKHEEYIDWLKVEEDVSVKQEVSAREEIMATAMDNRRRHRPWKPNQPFPPWYTDSGLLLPALFIGFILLCVMCWRKRATLRRGLRNVMINILQRLAEYDNDEEDEAPQTGTRILRNVRQSVTRTFPSLVPSRPVSDIVSPSIENTAYDHEFQPSRPTAPLSTARRMRQQPLRARRISDLTEKYMVNTPTRVPAGPAPAPTPAESMTTARPRAPTEFGSVRRSTRLNRQA